MTLVDILIVAAYILASILIGIWFSKKAGQSKDAFFLAGRSAPWWLIGVSMAATNFSVDTPIAIVETVYSEGIAGVWFVWAGLISVSLVSFVFARLWRRSGVMTDVELTELRYDGQSAAVLRVLKGLYFGAIFNIFIVGWVFLAMYKMIQGLTPFNPIWILGFLAAVALFYSASGGFYSVLVTDMMQYVIALLGSIFLAAAALYEVGGITTLVTKLNERTTGTTDTTSFLPTFGEDGTMPFVVLGTYLTVQWWANKYADGGGKHIQRMLSARSERDAVGGSFLYAILNYTLQIWPWILVALCSMVLLDPSEQSDSMQVYSKTMTKVLPIGLLGLCVTGLVGAFMSTIDTHLHLGASYLVNDIYRRFLVKGADDKHYVAASRVAMGLILIMSIGLSISMDSVVGAWKFLLTFAGGAGATWIIRWFWWRANAWTEFSGMLASGICATALQAIFPDWHYTSRLLVTVAVSTLTWLIVTLLTPPTSDEQLVVFAKRVRPGRMGWGRIYDLAGIDRTKDIGVLGRNLMSVLLGITFLLGLCFSIGQLIFGEVFSSLVLAMIALVAGLVLYRLEQNRVSIEITTKDHEPSTLEKMQEQI
ncbi:sodium:solute symporter family protein [Poriferisphaera sp. WC338]|uniref:sodium:solute symporter family protein n=1 Tax=Poriferisphaera sp. WC338 TaxID=3425129 RepID=UPI003D8194EC